MSAIIMQPVRPPTLISLTYVSECRVPVGNQDVMIQAILAFARESNAADGITGALLFTGLSFVQTLEGPEIAVSALMTRIEGDRRHTGVAVIDRHEVKARTFAHWSMAYSGPSVFVEREVARALEGARGGRRNDVNRLLRLVREFGASAQPRPPG